MNKTLLIVDDEEGIRNVLKISLEDAGYTVHTAGGVEEALGLFNALHPGIILTDIKMPGQTGLDLLRRVKELDRDTEVIMLTGHGDLDLAIQSLKLDATDFLTKPVNDDMLVFSLRRAEERIAMRNELKAYAEDLERKVKEQSAQLVEAERQLAALQVVNGISSGLSSLSRLVDADAQEDASLFNELPCFVSVQNRDLDIISINDLYRERFGDLRGKKSWQAYTPPGGPTNRYPAALVLEDGVGHRSEEKMYDAQGCAVQVLCHTVPIYNNDGDIELILELGVDMSQVRELREELRFTRERFRRLFHESPSYIAVINKNMEVTEANHRFRRDFGEPCGRHCHDLYLHRESPCKDCPALLSFTDGLVHQSETVVTASDGRQVNVLVVTAPLYDAQGNVAEVMELSTDITELRSLQDHLAHLGLLLGSTAHGLKGLLTALDGSIYRMGSGLKLDKPDRVQDAFKDIRFLSGKLRKLVLDILHYSKNRELACESLQLADFAKECAALVADKAAEMGVAFDCAVPDDGGGTFEADSGAVSSALVNVLENAIEACAAGTSFPPGGSRVRFTALAGPDDVVFEVQDNGPGMDRETKEKVFTLFFSSKGQAGTGIGLFVASSMVREHGGSIQVESEPGQGALFRIRLPRSASCQSSSPA